MTSAPPAVGIARAPRSSSPAGVDRSLDTGAIPPSAPHVFPVPENPRPTEPTGFEHLRSGSSQPALWGDRVPPQFRRIQSDRHIQAISPIYCLKTLPCVNTFRPLEEVGRYPSARRSSRLDHGTKIAYVIAARSSIVSRIHFAYLSFRGWYGTKPSASSVFFKTYIQQVLKSRPQCKTRVNGRN